MHRVVLIAVIGISGCSGTKGDPGPEGPMGPMGSMGSAGVSPDGGGGLAWTSITTNTQAQGNHGYIANSASPIALTLPTSSALGLGDEVRLVNTGAGDVSIALNPGQSFRYDPNALAMTWSAPHGPTKLWNAVTSSSDGSKLVAVSATWSAIRSTRPRISA